MLVFALALARLCEEGEACSDEAIQDVDLNKQNQRPGLLRQSRLRLPRKDEPERSSNFTALTVFKPPHHLI
jgi:hypothetical protein